MSKSDTREEQLTTPFQIVRFTAAPQRIIGASLQVHPLLAKKRTYVRHTEIEIPLGRSRVGGPVADLPRDIAYPRDHVFVAQLDLAQFASHDVERRLPPRGQLIFFTTKKMDRTEVFYSDVTNESLVRTVKEHEDAFYDGVLIDRVFPDVERLADRFTEPEDEDQAEDANDEGKVWDYFAGSKVSKLFGLYTDCQLGADEIEELSFSDEIVLLQIGEDGFNDEGVSLARRDFSKCRCHWAQS